jgi:hypothetical protein
MKKEEIKNLITKVTSLEATQELAGYWEKRYIEILEKGYFIISSKTEEKLLSKEKIDSPITPYGDIDLSNHIDKNNELDEILLQSTIQGAVRFLDSVLDFLNFEDRVRNIILQYRKIGVGIAGLEEYMEIKKEFSEIDQIDYLGNLIASSVYRTSETLAEEKGVCKNWELINKHLRPKSFEHWVSYETGEQKNGLEISQIFDQDLIKDSDFEIKPRRNSNLLLLPGDLEWQIWSDRDETGPLTPIQDSELKQEEVKTQNIFKEESKDKDKKEIEIIEINPGTAEIKIEDRTELEPNPQEIIQTTPQEIETSQFKIGELVHIDDDNQEIDKNKIFQIIDVIKDSQREIYRYRLMGGEKDFENEFWPEESLVHADVLSLLDDFNHNEYQINLFANALIINDEGQILAQKVEDKLILPGDQIVTSIEIKEFLANLLKENYGIEVIDYEEAFIIEEIQADFAHTDIHLGFLLKAEPFELFEDLVWLDPTEVEKLFYTDFNLVVEYFKYLERIDDFAELKADRKIQEQIDTELAILPTEEEIQTRIDQEVKLKLEEAKNPENEIDQDKSLEEIQKLQEKIKIKDEILDQKDEKIEVLESRLSEIEAKSEEKQESQNREEDLVKKDKEIKGLQDLKSDYEKRIEELESKIYYLENELSKEAQMESLQPITAEVKESQIEMEEIDKKVQEELESKISEFKESQEEEFENRIKQERAKIKEEVKLESENKIREEVAKRVAKIKSIKNSSPISQSISTLKLMQKYSAKNSK